MPFLRNLGVSFTCKNAQKTLQENVDSWHQRAIVANSLEYDSKTIFELRRITERFIQTHPSY